MCWAVSVNALSQRPIQAQKYVVLTLTENALVAFPLYLTYV